MTVAARPDVTRSGADRFETSLVAVIAVATLLGLSRYDSTIYNNYVLLADAFLHGHAWILWPGQYIDALPWNGQHFVIEAPIPGVLLMPLVAIFGYHTNQTAFACVAAGLSVAVAWNVARRLGAPLPLAAALTLFFAFGTDVAWCAIYGGVWFVAHSTAVLFAMLAVTETLGRRRLWLVVLWLALAAGCRFSVVLALIPLVAYVVALQSPAERKRALGPAIAVLAPAIALYVIYNEVRWGTPYDIGYTEWYHQDQIGQPTGSPFRLRYLRYELDSFFLTIPRLVRGFPWIAPSYSAVAIEVASPALVLAFFVREKSRLVLALAAAATLVAVPSFVYYANGGSQFGMRHALDFMPFMFPLVVLATRRVPSWISYPLLYVSVAVGLWGIWFWRTFYDSYLVHTLPPGYPH